MVNRIILSSTEVARLLGVSARTVQSWVTANVVRPPREGNSPYLFRLQDLFAAAVARELRRRGVSLPQASGVMDWLLAQELDDLRADWRRGRTLLVIVGDYVMPFLMAPGDVLDNPAIDLA